MRTTLNLNDDLVRQAKKRAAAEDRTLTSVIEDALRRLLATHDRSPRREPYQVSLLPPSDLQPGLDPNDPVFYRKIFEEDDLEKYGRSRQALASGPDAAL